MSIQSKLKGINEKLDEAGLKTQVSLIKKRSLLNKKEGLQIVVNEVEESNQISISAQVQTILRESLGYGTVESEYDINLKKVELEYFPIQNVRVVSANYSFVRENQMQHNPVIRKDRYERVSTPGCTYLEK